MNPESKSLQIRCGGCQALLKVQSESLDRTFACPKCGKKMKLVKPSASTAASVPSKAFADSPLDDLSELPPANFNMPSMPTSAYQARVAGAGSKNRMGARNRPLPWLWIGIASMAAAAVLVVVGISAVMLSSGSKTPSPAAAASSMSGNSPSGNAPSGNATATRSNAVSVPPVIHSVIDFPKLEAPAAFGSTGIVWHRVAIPRPTGTPLKLNIFIPKGDHADKSLPVVFEAPAGTPLLHGASIEVPQPATEFLPFTEAGMITVSFDIDGEMPSNVSPEDGARYMNQLRTAYSRFVAADAGVDDGKLAIDFVLARLPMADPDRLITWGHSSAATLSLLLASKDPRISKCIAMAPITDLKPRLGDILVQEPAMSKYLPKFDAYLVSGSPITYVSKLKCPVFIAHARNDDNAPFEVTKTYVDAIRSAGGTVQFLELQREGHYAPLLEAAIPKALEWLN